MPHASSPAVTIRPIRAGERDELDRVVTERWGSPLVASRGALHRVSELACLLAVEGERWLGVAAYRPAGDSVELVLLEAFERGRGAGTALIDAVADLARKAGARRLWLVTTNDNLDALRFYQRRGMRLVQVWPGAVTQARETLKPEIPLIGEYRIPIRDELELELALGEFAPDAGSPADIGGPA